MQLSTNRRLRVHLAVPLIALLLMAGCEQKSLQRAAIYGKTATEELAEIQALTLDLHQAGTLDEPSTAAIVRTVLRANAALQTAKNTVARIKIRVDAGSKFSAQDRAALQGLFTDFARAITELNNAGVAGVKNPEAVKRWNLLIRSVVQTTNLLVALW